LPLVSRASWQLTIFHRCLPFHPTYQAGLSRQDTGKDYKHMFPEVNKVISRKSICGFTIGILALQYASFLNLNFIADDYAYLYKAKYYFSLYNVFVDQFVNGLFYRPLTDGLLYKIFYSMAGLNPACYRAFILLVFFLNTLLVYELTLLLFHEKYIAWSAAVFFVTRIALAPEVLWIAIGFEDTVATFFILSTFVTYLLLHKKNTIIGFYIAALLSAVLGILSRESAMVIPLIIILIECSCLQCLNFRLVTKVLIKVIPFSLVAACPLIRMITDTHFARARAGFYESGFSFHHFLANLYFFFQHSFNSSLEMYSAVIFLAVAFGTMRYTAEGVRLLAYACGVIFIGLMPYISLTTGLSTYYLSISLIGISMLFAVGIKNIAERFPAIQTVLVMSLVPLLGASSLLGLKTTKTLDDFFMSEKISSQAIAVFKKEFPALPEESFVYIENCDQPIRWSLQDSKALRLIYNNSVSVYFEGVSKRKMLPARCSGIYVFSSDNNKLHFKQYIKGVNLKSFLDGKHL